jgi:dTDP-4-amino-4,6-dideoxygalactose transaminase
MDDIIRLCKEKNLRLIEDVAHAPGAVYGGKKCGVFGDVSCFSFFTNKNLSVGEGGMVVARDPDVNNSLKYLRSHGMSTLTLDRHQGRAITYDVLQAGLNYRMDEMRAALGIVQLEKLDEANAQRAALTRTYNQRLADLEDIQIPFKELRRKTSAYHIYPILLSSRINREKLFLSLKSKGIQASIHYPPIKSFSAYQTELLENATPNCDIVCARELTLPLFPTMKEEAVSLVVSALKESLIEQV